MNLSKTADEKVTKIQVKPWAKVSEPAFDLLNCLVLILVFDFSDEIRKPRRN